MDKVNSVGVITEEASALIISQSSISLIESTFTRFRGSIWSSNVIQKRTGSDHASVGGVIIAISSVIHISSCVFQSNYADLGGALHTELLSRVTITKSTFADHNATYGGVLFIDEGYVIIDSSTFIGNILSHSNESKVTRGGVIQAYKSKILVHNDSFSMNYAYRGAVIESRDSVIELNSTRFFNNIAKLTGGVAMFKRCTLAIYQSIFESNTATERSGGVLHVVKSNLTIKGGSFRFNVAGDLGGVAIIKTKSSVQISLSHFDINQAYSRGGALYYTDKTNLSLIDSKFNGNKAYTGGAISVNTGSHLHTSGLVSFANNSAYYGGAIQIQFGSFECVCKLTFSKNAASWGVFSFYQSSGSINGSISFNSNKGSLLSFGSDLTLVSGRAFVQNNSPNESLVNFHGIREGGGITSFLSKISLKGKCTFQNNSAHNGGGILATSSTIEIFDEFTVSTNDATDTGGGLYLYHSNVIVDGGSVLISGNRASNKGGGIHLVSSSVVLLTRYQIEGNVAFEHNIANLGGGVCMEASSKLYITTKQKVLFFTYNTAEYGGAIFVSDETNNGTCNSNSQMAPTSDSDCFFQSAAFTTSDNQRIKYKIMENLVSFSGNSANKSGDILYGGLLDRCTIDVFDKKAYIKILYSSQPNFIDELLNFTSSNAVRLCFCKDSNSEVDCSFQPDTVNVTRGENCTLHVAAVDQVNHTLSNITIHGHLMNKRSSLGKGMQSQVTKSLKCTALIYRAYGTPDQDDADLVPKWPLQRRREITPANPN